MYMNIAYSKHLDNLPVMTSNLAWETLDGRCASLNVMNALFSPCMFFVRHA